MPKILVVDDVLDNVKLLAYELSDHGYEVVTAADGPAALRRARETAPDVILLDVMMPGMDGIEVCRRLKADPELRPIPVVMVSARELEDDVVDGLDAGAHDYVTKPFNPRILLARVRSAAHAKADHDLIAELNRRLAEQATVDPLTGAGNRAYLRDAMVQAMALSRRRGLPLSLVMLDVDHFKTYNDTFGHPAGDEVLRTVVDVLSGLLRAYDVIARYGGEEFVVLMPATDADAARVAANRLRAGLTGYPWPRRSVTASLGVATTDGRPTEPLTLLVRADRALYHAKRTGRDRVVHERDLRPSATPVDPLPPAPPRRTPDGFQTPKDRGPRRAGSRACRCGHRSSAVRAGFFDSAGCVTDGMTDRPAKLSAGPSRSRR